MSLHTIPLPTPVLSGSVSVEQALVQRRSTRQFAPRPLSLASVGQLLWAAQGITSPEGFRTAPSAGAICPIELYLVAGNVEGLPPGLYKYTPKSHQLALQREGEFLPGLAAACFNQACVANAAALIGFNGTFEAMIEKYGAGSEKFVDMEVGHASQNVHLQAVSLGLGTVVVAAIREPAVREILGIPAREKPIYFMPVGYPL